MTTPNTSTELRCRGVLLGFHPSVDAAKKHAAKHHTDVDKDDLTFEPARPVRLYCRGNLVDTFMTKDGALASAKRRETRHAPSEAWLVVDVRDLASAEHVEHVLATHAAAIDPPPPEPPPAPALPSSPTVRPPPPPPSTKPETPEAAAAALEPAPPTDR